MATGQPGAASVELARYQPAGYPVFHLWRGDILQHPCHTIVVITDENMNFDHSTPSRNGNNAGRPGYYAWRILANGYPIPPRSPQPPRTLLVQATYNPCLNCVCRAYLCCLIE